jgi:hypothetical protein
VTDIADILAERGKSYGSFDDVARIAQALKSEMVMSRNWSSLAPDQLEALEMIASKIGRILNGDKDHLDGWSDIAGYAKLVADRLGKASLTATSPEELLVNTSFTLTRDEARLASGIFPDLGR